MAELLENGQLGPWVPHLAAAADAPYNHSSAADVALVAGQLAVLPNGTLAVSVRAARCLAWPGCGGFLFAALLTYLNNALKAMLLAHVLQGDVSLLGALAAGHAVAIVDRCARPAGART